MRTKLLFTLLGLVLGAGTIIAVNAAGPRPRAMSASAAQYPDLSRVEPYMDKVIPEIKFDAVPLEQAVEFLRQATGAPIEVHWEGLEQRTAATRATPVTLKARDVTLADALPRLIDSI